MGLSKISLYIADSNLIAKFKSNYFFFNENQYFDKRIIMIVNCARSNVSKSYNQNIILKNKEYLGNLASVFE